MAGWPSSNLTKIKNPRAGIQIDPFFMGGTLLSPKSGTDLMQNCDLPPPSKVFSGSENMIFPSVNRVFTAAKNQDDFDVNRCGVDDHERLELLRALGSSQTRAREAERKAATLAMEKDCVASGLVQESLKLFAYRQWVRLLEIQVSTTRQQWKKQEMEIPVKDGNSIFFDGDDDGGESNWIVALAFYLGIVSLGLAFGYCYCYELELGF